MEVSNDGEIITTLDPPVEDIRSSKVVFRELNSNWRSLEQIFLWGATLAALRTQRAVRNPR
jgi:hypothetical protein